MEGGNRVLTAFPEDLSAKAEGLVKRLGVEIRKGVMVTGVDGEGVTYKHEEVTEKLRAKTVLWAGGVVVTEFGKKLAERTRSETDRSGRVKVNPDLTTMNYPDVFIAGDLALVAGASGKPLPGVAQVAIQGGAYAAKTIRARVTGGKALPAFRYFDKGDMAVIGRAAAVANVFGMHLSGLPAWLIWLFVHLMYIVEFQNRVIVFVQWGFQYLTFSRGARLITGAAETDVDRAMRAKGIAPGRP